MYQNPYTFNTAKYATQAKIELQSKFFDKNIKN